MPRKAEFVEDRRVGAGPPDVASSRVADVFDSRVDRDWLNPNSMRTLQDAVKARSNSVVLNEVKYSIEYGFWFKSKIFPPRESVKLTRVDGFFAPFGYIPVKRIMSFDYEAAQE